MLQENNPEDVKELMQYILTNFPKHITYVDNDTKFEKYEKNLLELANIIYDKLPFPIKMFKSKADIYDQMKLLIEQVFKSYKKNALKYNASSKKRKSTKHRETL